MSKAISVRWLAGVVAGVVVGVILATSVGALAIPAAGRAASIARCDVTADRPFHNRNQGPRIFYFARVSCNGSVTLDRVVASLQRQRFGGSWRVIAKGGSDRVEVHRQETFTNYKDCVRRLSGTFRTIAIIAKGSNSEKDVSPEEHIRHCGSS
jgi:hypothetical protein